MTENIRAEWMSERFYNTSVAPEIASKGECCLEWHISKSELVKQVNWLRNKGLKVVWLEKEGAPNCFHLFIKPTAP